MRALSGAFLFAVPLLFTMEMWWIGTHASSWQLTAVLILALVANYALARAAGFKRHRLNRQPETDEDNGSEPNPQQAKRTAAYFEEALDAVAVGVVAATVMLFALNQISLTDPLDVVLGRIVVQALPLSLGASVANTVFARGASRSGGVESGGADHSQAGRESSLQPGEHRDARQSAHSSPLNDSDHVPAWKTVVSDIGATATGGVFLGFSIAPTEEIPLLSGALTLGHQIGLIALALATTYAIVFASGFDPEQVQGRPPGPFQSPITETALAYIVSLVISLGALYLFGHVEAGDSLATILAQTIVLAVPTSIGGAAGRLVL